MPEMGVIKISGVNSVEYHHDHGEIMLLKAHQ